jgi:eukaryotic-like serine/threonine-protein kinase
VEEPDSGGTRSTLGDSRAESILAAATAGPARGEAIGRYVVLERLGAGGMGEVFAAYDPELDRKVALKLMHAELGPRAARNRRLLREAQAMARLTHPNVMTIHDVGEHRGRVFLAMEFVAGPTLRDWMLAAKRPVKDVVAVFVRAGRGLAAAHDKGLVHRDFKPDNVMLTEDPHAKHGVGRVLVMDFGLARPLGAGARPDDEADLRPRTDALGSDLTARGAVVGTPAYMAPEQHLGEAIDARSDQFAFCVGLWEALAGERPFRGEHAAALAHAVVEGQRAPMPAAARIPAAIRRAIERGLSTAAGDRHSSMDALLAELERDPARPRRIALAGVTVGALAGGAWAWHAMREWRVEARCDTASARAQEIWNDAARGRVEEGFAASTISYAGSTLAHVLPVLDRYADDWAHARLEWCHAAERDGLRDREIYGRAQACLDERIDALAALVELLGEPDAETVRRAVQSASALPAVSACDDERWLRQRIALPDDPDERARVQELRERLTRVAARASAGRYGEAQRMAEGVVADAEALGWAPVVAEARFAEGSLLERTGDYAAAEAALVDALARATAAGHDELAVSVAGLLASVIGVRLARPDEGLRWGALAQALAARLDLGDDPRTARILNSLGAAHHAKGDLDRALELLGRSLAIREAALGPDHLDVAESLNNLGGVHWARREHAEALELNRRALAIREAALGPDHPEVGSSHNNLGGALYARGDKAGALEHFERALAIWEHGLGPGHALVASALVNVGTVLRDRGQLEEALAKHERALAILERVHGSDHPDLTKCLDSLALVHDARGDAAAATAVRGRAAAIRDRLAGRADGKAAAIGTGPSP